MTTYRVEIYRDDRWWMIRVPELDGVDGLAECIGQSRRLEDVTTDAQDIIGLVADVAPSEIALDLRIHVDGIAGDLAEISAHIADDRAAAHAAEERAITRSRQLAHALHEVGVPVRDIASVTGVSFQRAQQLVKESAADSERKMSA